MKLRQKLAMVLATAMVVTAVPVVTFAASTNGVTKVVTVAKDTVLNDATTGSALKIKAEDAKIGEIFFLELENAEWKDGDKTVITGVEGAEITVTGKTTATVKITADAPTLEIPMLTKVTGGVAAVTVVAENSSVTGDKYVFAKTPESDETVLVSFGDTTKLYTEGQIADIKVEEVVVGALAKGGKLEITLNSDEFEFAKAGELTVEYGKGFAGKTEKVTAKFENNDYNVLVVELPELVSTSARGSIALKGIEVQAVKGVKAPTTGDLTVDVDSELIANVKDAKVATVAQHGVTMSVKDDEVVEIVAGKAKEVEFKLEQVIEDSLSIGRTVDFELDNGFFGDAEGKNKAVIKVNGVAVEAEDFITKKIDDVERVVGFTHTVKESDKGEIKVNAAINSLVGTTADITVKAEGRAIDEEASLAIAKVTPDFTVETTSAKLEVGVKDQKGGQIVVKEAAKGALAKNEVITIQLADDKGINFTDKPVVETTGDMKVETTFVKATSDAAAKIEVKVTRASNEAATITIKDIPVTIDRTVAEGGYDAEITVSNRAGQVKGENFFTIGEGIATTVTTTITNGATEMVVNGEKVALDAPAYIKNGKLMTPLRAVSEAFGIKASDIVYNAGEIMIFANGRTIQLTIGSNVAYVNGAKMTLANPAEIKNERTFVPVGDLGRLLGLDVKWDNTTKTATFNN